jgi:hypothetical protein
VASVVIVCLKKFHAIIEHLVDQSIRLRYAPGPYVPIRFYGCLTTAFIPP